MKRKNISTVILLALVLLRQERPVPFDLNPQKLLDFSLLPAGR